MKLDILAFAAHPDDVELSCAGTLIKYIKQGKKVGIVDLSRGELGTRGSAEIRKSEYEIASKILGVHVRENMNFEDGFFTYNKEYLLRLIEIIRKYQPQIVLANAPDDRHPDHGRASKLVSDACFYSGLAKIDTQFQGKSQACWRPANVYLYIQDYLHKPDFTIDISDYMEQKMDAIRAFKSQFFNPDSKEPDTAISSAEFLEFIKARSMNFGRYSFVKYAEGFLVQRVPEVMDLFALK